MEELDIITLEGKDYVITKMMEYNHKTYFLLDEMDNNENLLNNRFIGQLVVNNGIDSVAKLKKDDLEYQEVMKLFNDLLN